jgi:16S rRNA (uracil1498-N3)-methyltransferase
LSGPEGGFSEEEEGLAMRQGFMPVSLGSNTLRAETAPLVVLSQLL